MKTEFKIGELYEFTTSVKNIFLCLDEIYNDEQKRIEILFIHLNSNQKFSWPVEVLEDRLLPLKDDDEKLVDTSKTL